MSVVEASERSGLSRQWWMDAEKGVRRDRGKWVPTSLRPENLARAVKAVGGDLAAIFDLAGFDPTSFRSGLDAHFTDADGNAVAVQVKGGGFVVTNPSEDHVTQLVVAMTEALGELRTEIRSMHVELLELLVAPHHGEQPSEPEVADAIERSQIESNAVQRRNQRVHAPNQGSRP